MLAASAAAYGVRVRDTHGAYARGKLPCASGAYDMYGTAAARLRHGAHVHVNTGGRLEPVGQVVVRESVARCHGDGGAKGGGGLAAAVQQMQQRAEVVVHLAQLRRDAAAAGRRKRSDRARCDHGISAGM